MKKPAFTLAEVLVTLGIIGIVAAMTLPMLAKNYQFFIRQQQFKKAYAALSAAVQKTQIDMGEGVECIIITDKWNEHIRDCDLFYDELTKNLEVAKICRGNAYEKKCFAPEMRNGTDVYVEVQGGEDKDAAKQEYSSACGGFGKQKLNQTPVYVYRAGFTLIPYYTYSAAPVGRLTTTNRFIIDINAQQGPNKWGHDMFLFVFEKQKKYDSVFTIKPSSTCHALDFGGYYTKHFFEYLYGQNAEL